MLSCAGPCPALLDNTHTRQLPGRTFPHGLIQTLVPAAPLPAASADADLDSDADVAADTDSSYSYDSASEEPGPPEEAAGTSSTPRAVPAAGEAPGALARAAARQLWQEGLLASALELLPSEQVVQVGGRCECLGCACPSLGWGEYAGGRSCCLTLTSTTATCLPPQVMAALTSCLVEGIAASAAAAQPGPGADSASPSAGGAPGWPLAPGEAVARRWAARCALVCGSCQEAARQQLLDALLAAVPQWQAWVVPPCDLAEPSRGAAGSGASGAMACFAAALQLHIGAAAMLRPAERGGRLWLLGELLCCEAAAGAGVGSGALHLACLAAQRHALAAAAAEPSASGAAATGLLRVVTVLYRGGCTHPEEVRAVSYCAAASTLLRDAAGRAARAPGLLQLLQALTQHEFLPDVADRRELDGRLGGALGALLPAVAPALRCAGEEAVLAAGLDQLAIQLARSALEQLPVEGAAPPAAAAAAGAAPAISSQAQLLLRLAGSCFPSQPDLAASAGYAAAGGASTPDERRALLALVRNCSAPAAAAPSEDPAAAEAAALACGLQLSAVAYCWRDMGPPEWQAVLCALQQQLSAARQQLQRLAGRAAAAACGAAAQLLGADAVPPSQAEGGGGGEEPMSPATALQMLQGLSAKGLLQRHAVGVELAVQLQQLLGSCTLPAAAVTAAQTLAALLQLQPRLQGHAKAPQLEYPLQAAVSELLGALFAVGAVAAGVAAAGGGGAEAGEGLLAWVEQQGQFWGLVARAVVQVGGGCAEHVGAGAVTGSGGCEARGGVGGGGGMGGAARSTAPAIRVPALTTGPQG